jgi:hypothetical protein
VENSGLMQDSASSPNRATRDEQDPAGGRSGDSYCTNCRTIGHVARDCRRVRARVMHQDVDRELPLSEYIAPICAAQIEGQAFSVYLIDLLNYMLGRGTLLLLSLC